MMRKASILLPLLMVACAHRAPVTESPLPSGPAPTANAAPVAPAAAPDAGKPPKPRQRKAPPEAAFQLGLMGHSSTGMSGFRLRHPTYDGRGVLIAILDGGVDPGIAGLRLTTTGDPKIVDLRDVSGEGVIPLQRSADGTTWTGAIREITFGGMPQADLNGDGDNHDSFPVEATRDSVGWKARIDTNGNGSLADESWVRDYSVRRESFTFSSRYAQPGAGPITAALNLTESGGEPQLILVLDTGGHGTHVAGIAAGNDIYGVAGFDGVAPGAQIVGIKFADNLRGSVTTSGSMERAMEYAARVATERHLPLVMNMSFGVGNARMGRAVSDSLVDRFLLAHPDVIFTIAAGNEGPGTSTMGQPGSSQLALTIGAIFPRAASSVFFDSPNDAMGWWGSRGGALAKPDLVAPGYLYSTVPVWKTGDELALGTSMAAPYVAGLAAVLVSAAQQEHLDASAAQVVQALRATARPLSGYPHIDQGFGVPDVDAAWAWLRAGHEARRFRVEAPPASDEVTTPPGRFDAVTGLARTRLPTAAYRPAGLLRGDTLQRFRVSVIPDGRSSAPARPLVYRLASSASWLRLAQPMLTLDSATGSAVALVRYDAAQLTQPGRYVGTVTATSAADTLAGPAFVFDNTVVVPEALPLAVRGRRVAAGGEDHFSVRVPEGATGLAVTLTAHDTAALGTLTLFEPTDRPARGAKSVDLGDSAGTHLALAIPGDQLPAGVWQITFNAFPGAPIVYDLAARLSPVRFTAIDSSAAPSVTVAGEPGSDTTLQASLDLLGVALDWDAVIDHGAVVHRTIAVPAWATRLRIEAEVTPDVWEQVTDYSISVFDSAGNRIANEALNFPYGRLEADLPEHRAAGYAATVELFPGFAGTPPERCATRVRIRFEADPRPLASQPVRLPAGATLGAPAVTGLEAPDGWRYLLRIRLAAGERDRTPTTRLFTIPASR